MRFVAGYVAFLVAFGICDAVWLGTMTARLYRPALGDLIVEQVRYVPAALFYFGFPLGVLHFAVMPALRDGNAGAALVNGALIGLLAYATYDLTNYNKALMQRNKLLKEMEGHPDLADTLSVWDEQLVKFGVGVIRRRKEFIEELNGILEEVHTSLTGGKEKLILQYRPNVLSEEKVLSSLRTGQIRDMGAGPPLSGPHRDDMDFSANDIDVRHFGSQGQQRTAALSLKLAEIELVKKKTGDFPVLLLDDVFSELDAGRQSHLLDHISRIQTILTCTGMDEFVKNNVRIDRKYFVENGTVTE